MLLNANTGGNSKLKQNVLNIVNELHQWQNLIDIFEISQAQKGSFTKTTDYDYVNEWSTLVLFI